MSILIDRGDIDMSFFVVMRHNKRKISVVLLILLLLFMLTFVVITLSGRFVGNRQSKAVSFRDGMTFIVDRIEGQFAICETEQGEMKTLRLGLLPKGSKEGEVLVTLDGRLVSDTSIKYREKSQLEAHFNQLWK